MEDMLLSKVTSKLRLHTGTWNQPSYKRCFLCMVVTILLTVLLCLMTPVLNTQQTTHIRIGHDNASQTLRKMLQAFANPGHPVGTVVPKIFHQTYKTATLPAEYKKYVAKCRNLNPDWRYFLWRDVDIEAFMAEYFPQYVRKYKTFTMNVQRADFIRYMVLYHYGGVYLDMDVDCVRPFFPSLEGQKAFLDQERLEHANILYNREFMAMNSAMGSVAKHPFFLYMLESVNQVADDAEGASLTTGPERLTVAYREWAASDCQRSHPVTLLGPSVFSPIADVKLHNFGAICRKVAAAATVEANDNARWPKAGCKLLAAKGWKVDATDNSTVGKHLFLHMGYKWGPKTRDNFDVAKELGPVFLYTVNRM